MQRLHAVFVTLVIRMYYSYLLTFVVTALCHYAVFVIILVHLDGISVIDGILDMQSKTAVFTPIHSGVWLNSARVTYESGHMVSNHMVTSAACDCTI